MPSGLWKSQYDIKKKSFAFGEVIVVKEVITPYGR